VTEGLRDCDTCNNPFVAEEDWKRQCVICWKADKGYKLANGDKAFQGMQAAYIELRGFNEQVAQNYSGTMMELEEAREKLREEKRKMRALRKELHGERQQRKKEKLGLNGPMLSQKRIMALIKLAHPDKHGGSELATKMTQWLLAHRSK